MSCSAKLTSTIAVLALALGFANVPAGQDYTFPVITPADLKEEAVKAHPALAGLYRFVAAPADKVVLADSKEIWVEPLPQFFGAQPAFTGTIVLTVVAGEEAGKKKEITAGALKSVTPFEHFALEKIAAYLKNSAAENDPSPSIRLRGAEKALQALAWFHDGTRSHPPVGASPWQEIHDRLYGRLKKVRADELDLLAELGRKDNTWTAAVAFADRLQALYPDDGLIGHHLRQFWSAYGLLRIVQNDYAAARKLMTRMEATYLRSPEAQALKEKLLARAGELVEEAKKLPEREAREKLAEALTIWPRLPGARAGLLERSHKQSVLYVGVRSLPEWLSPATAWTDAEKQAVDLLFEGPVQPHYRPELGQRYEPVLADRLPNAMPLRRHIQLRRDAYWSDGERVTSADVRHTVQLLLDMQPAARDLIQVPRVEQESFTVDFQFGQGYFDPLALLSFKVLPQNYRGKTLLRADDPEFARAPVGSGPFQFAGQQSMNGRNVAVFSINSQHIRTPQPVLREIRVFAWQNPSALLKANDIGAPLLLDVPTEQLPALRTRGLGNVRTALERRVYFLALNHRIPNLRHADLRRALAHAIDREKILDNHFRGQSAEARALEVIAPALVAPLPVEKHPELHYALNGLYPADSWAFCPPPRVPASLYDAGRAKALFRAVQKLGPVTLTLKYPDDDPRLGPACRAIGSQVQKTALEAGVKVQVLPQPLPPHALKQAVSAHDYELAYYHVDYNDEDYWLWPLFDTHPDALRKGGTNFLGYENDAKLQSLFRAALGHRDFPALRGVTHNIHAHLTLHMPLIPLWQLHRHIVVPPHLDPGDIEPLHLFRRIAEWKINP